MRLAVEPRAEILSVKDNGEHMLVSMSFDNHPVIDFEVHKSDWRSYPRDKEREAMLARQAESLLATYGDARQPREEG